MPGSVCLNIKSFKCRMQSPQKLTWQLVNNVLCAGPAILLSRNSSQCCFLGMETSGNFLEAAGAASFCKSCANQLCRQGYNVLSTAAASTELTDFSIQALLCSWTSCFAGNQQVFFCIFIGKKLKLVAHKTRNSTAWTCKQC